jgi:hypothetical protein
MASHDTMEDLMKNIQRTYVVTLNAPSHKGLRLWVGKSIHDLRHCSVKQVSQVLRELQQTADSLHIPASSVGESYSLNRGR